MKFLKLSLCILLVGLFSKTNAQNGLQVDFETGFPIGDLHEQEHGGSQNLGNVGTLDDPTLEWRLPQDVFPIEYDLTITPILDDAEEKLLGENFTAPGEVTIHLRVVNPTMRIRMHTAVEIINSSQVIESSSGDIITHSRAIDLRYQFLTLNLESELEVNKTYQVYIKFTSVVKNAANVNELNGLYRTSYLDPSTNEEKFIATTQMEALHARQMFPCFDEPTFKAPFYIKIGRKDSRVALTTTHSTRNQTMTGVPGWVWEDFAPTVPMPTYLLALIVSEFTFDDAPPSIYPGKQVRTYAPKHFIDQNGGIYAAEKAAMLLSYFETEYVEKYPLQKMDSAAVPAFTFGAMENYGLNIYRETALLYFPTESTEAERYSISRILAHELAHQWFGNLVSPKWWTHIWLNEGFATYVAAQGSEKIAPEFESWERFQNDAVQYSMGFDARSDYSHSVKIDENAWFTRDAMSWFDRMAYEKAGSLILMMRGFMNETLLRDGLITYLAEMKYKSGVQDDLFRHLHAKAASKIPADLTMKEIMDTWTLQPGFPLLRVAVADSNSIFISQERFLNNQVQTLDHVNQNSGLWYVPVTIATNASSETQWIYKDVAMKRISADTSQWVVVNSDANGYYRVIYDAHLTQLIKQELNRNASFIPARTRSQLLDDYFNAAWQKYTNLETALSLADYIGNEQEIVVWNTVLTNLRKPFNLLSNSGSFYASLRSFLLPRLQTAVALTGGIDNPNLGDRYGGMPVIRNLQFLDWLCAFEDADCIAYSKRLVDIWMTFPDAIDSIRRDIKPVVYCSAISSGNDTIFEFIHKQYRNDTTSTKQKGTLLNSLSCTKEISMINKLLETILVDTEGFYEQDVHGATIMQQLARNPLARTPILRFLRQNTLAIITKLGESAIANTINGLATYVSSQTEFNDIQTYLDSNPQLPVMTSAIKTIQDNIAWVGEFGEPMITYFNRM